MSNIILLHVKADDSACWKGIKAALAITPTSDQDLVAMLTVALDGMDADIVSKDIEVALVRRARDYLAGRSSAKPAA